MVFHVVIDLGRLLFSLSDHRALWRIFVRNALEHFCGGLFVLKEQLLIHEPNNIGDRPWPTVFRVYESPIMSATFSREYLRHKGRFRS